ncbi:MAG: hypothetical protein WBC63_09905 [Candidatus Bipolaricaulia bacterium]
MNASLTWDEGDVALPDVPIHLDDDMPAVTDAEGQAEFEDVVGRRHTISLDESIVEDFATHSLVCEETTKTITLDGDTEVLFCFTPRGFMDVDVTEDSDGD